MTSAPQKPFSQACENNKSPIFQVLKQVWPEHDYAQANVLEVGCGTGQHATFFAEQMPWLQWHPTDQAHYLPACQLWIDEARNQGINNLQAPIELDVLQTSWPRINIHGAFSANTAHIMHWPAVEALFAGLGERLPSSAAFCLYGPFRYQGKHTSNSNQQFDQQLRERDSQMGIRDLDVLLPLAASCGFTLQNDYAMPANNRTLVWRRQ